MGHATVIRMMGHDKLMYGSDYQGTRGRCVGVADTFVWLYGDMGVWKPLHTQIQPVQIGLEVLQALKWACWSERLSDGEVEDIFWNNAARLFNLRS
jgi:predicted TIM-barrel fold metal-dependent hydrolase